MKVVTIETRTVAPISRRPKPICHPLIPIEAMVYVIRNKPCHIHTHTIPPRKQHHTHQTITTILAHVAPTIKAPYEAEVCRW